MNIRTFSLLVGLLCLSIAARATVPIPDLVFFGKVYQKGNGMQIVNPPSIDITAKLNNGTVVVAQVTELVSEGDSAVQDFYILRIPREDGTQRTLPDYAIEGDVVHIFLNGEEILETSTVIANASGSPKDVRRLDLNGLNSAVVDTYSDGLPDDWEMTYFGNLTSQTGAGDSNRDGVTNFAAYVIGLDPRQSAGSKLPTLQKEGGNFVFYFRKNKNAAGLDYFVQKSPNLGLAAWQVVDGTLIFVSADGDADLYKMTIPGGLQGSEMFFRLMAMKR